MKFLISTITVMAFTGYAYAAGKKEENLDPKQKIAKCETAFAKLKNEKPPKEETASNMIKEKAKPEKPTNAAGEPQPGCAVITYEITKEGLAENFKVIEKSDKASEEAALGALFKWKFRKFEAKNQVIMFVF